MTVMITSSWCIPPGVPSTLAAVQGETYFTSHCRISARLASSPRAAVPHVCLGEWRSELPSGLSYWREGLQRRWGIVLREKKREMAAVIQDEVSWFTFPVWGRQLSIALESMGSSCGSNPFPCMTLGKMLLIYVTWQIDLLTVPALIEVFWGENNLTHPKP